MDELVETVTAVAAVVAEPREAPPDSFVLHAPLELAARAVLYQWVDPTARPAALDRIRGIAKQYEAFGPGIGPATGDPQPLDADAVLPSLAAAAHAPIFLGLYPLAEPYGVTTALARPLVRELARHDDWRIEWIDGPRPRTAVERTHPLVELLTSVPGLGTPGSDFIYPLMHQLDTSGLAREELAPRVWGIAPAVAAPLLQRIAVQSMLQEPPDHAPYGWTHCLTIPQGALLAGRGQLAVDVAATHVLGFRAALGRVPLDLGWTPPPTTSTVQDGIDAGCADAASAAFHAADRAATMRAIATYAAQHEDAHLVKYSLACFEAARHDPPASPLYLAAAASLCAWWRGFDRA